MKRKTRIYEVMTYSSKIRKELGGVGVYYSFGYESDMFGYRVLVFNRHNWKYAMYEKAGAKENFEYYKEDHLEEEYENKLLAELSKNTNLIIE